ncbi:ATP phosphoribosyltransferase [Microcystis aeruginosa NIES-2549]|uniref:ATP phosphoribosyltransferase n=1 Tax=Microcystis aeruginosa NIES-2549 TaxID=1641812 RepID=A0A0F6U7T4_MICAE|nr:ATP phosphoribosyltransferase [Microcystis aeruginosa NIES-2549]
MVGLGVSSRSSGDYFYLFSPHPTPYTLRPTPYTPHPTPHTPHPTPQSTLF